MSTPTGEDDFLYEFEAEVREELVLAEASHPEEPFDLPVPISAHSPCIRAFRGAESSRTSVSKASRIAGVFRSVRSRWADSRK